MCWFSRLHPNICEILEEKDTIKVKKVVKKLPGGILWSVYRGHRYELGKLCQMNEFIIYKRENNWLCDSAFHSYINTVKVYYDFLYREYCIEYNNAFIDGFSAEDHNYNLCILHCLIPKDSRYCINEYGEVVSDKILPLYTEPINLANDVLG
jgi:hypothetical protein